MQNPIIKKTVIFLVCVFLIAGLFSFFTISVIKENAAQIDAAHFRLPAGFISNNAIAIMQSFLFALIAIASYYVASNPININRRKNALVDLFIFLGSIFGWSSLVFFSANFQAAIAINVAMIVLCAITSLMFWMIDHRAGYFMAPVLLWTLWTMYLSIAFLALN